MAQLASSCVRSIGNLELGERQALPYLYLNSPEFRPEVWRLRLRVTFFLPLALAVSADCFAPPLAGC